MRIGGEGSFDVVSEMKVVYSAGKQVSFRIPQDWEDEPDGNGMMYYEPDDDGSTLRLSVLTFSNPNSNPDAPPTLAAEATKHQVPLESLPNGAFMVRTREKFRDEDEECSMETWQLEVKDQDHFLIAIFSLTLSEEQMQTEKYQEQLEMVDREVRLAQIQV